MRSCNFENLLLIKPIKDKEWDAYISHSQACSQDFQKGGYIWTSKVYVYMHKHVRLGWPGGMLPQE